MGVGKVQQASWVLVLLFLHGSLWDVATAARTQELHSIAGDARPHLRSKAQSSGHESSLHAAWRSNGASSDTLGRAVVAASAQTAADQLQVVHAKPDQHVRGQITQQSSSRHLSQIGPVYADVPEDMLGLESILAAAREAFNFYEPSLIPQQPRRPYIPRSRALGGAGSSRNLQGPGFPIVVTFQAVHLDDAEMPVDLRLPGPQRSFNMTVEPIGGAQQACVRNNIPYAAQLEVSCEGMVEGSKWQATLVDADSDNLVLASTNFTVGSTSSPEVVVDLGMLSVEASFDQLAWSGMYYPRPRHSTSTIIIHAIIVGAQIVVYTRQGGKEVVWDAQWTGSEGTTSFFLVPGARGVFWANMSVGETVLRTAPITLDEPLSVYQDANDFAAQTVPQLQQQQLTAVPQLLCTGEVEDVRGNAGTFPQSLAPLDAKQQSIYHPRGFTCRWQLTPDQPDVLLSVDYRGLLPDESIILELAPNNIIRLNSPDGGPGAVFQASVWVERSILVTFQTTRSSTSKVGAFSISWTSVANGRSNGILDSRTMVIVLSCVSAAGAMLAACCFWFVCCGRRRRAGGVAVAGEENGNRAGVQLLRVPSAVRELLPSKPYQAPEANPLPGAETEPDCCSICLVELEAGEEVTVLPCMHFYHKECIGSWLKRNCTCPLCKNNVLEAFKVQQYEARQARRNRRRALAAAAPAAAGAAAEPGASDGSSTPGSSHSGSHDMDAAYRQQHIEMTSLHPLGASAGHSPVAGWAGGSRSVSPWPPLDPHRAPSPAGAAFSGQADNGDAVVALTLLPVGARGGGRLPPLQQQQQGAHAGIGSDRDYPGGSNGSWLLSLTPAGSQATPPAGSGAATAAMGRVPSLVIPPSPSQLSMVSLQSGSVLATPEDFAPAAAAAAAHAAESASRQRSTSPSTLADAAQASVAALRSSSRHFGRRLQVLLSPASAAPPAADGAQPAPAAVAPVAARAASSNAAGAQGMTVRGSSPLPPLPPAPAGPRVAVSIYAYAGHPAGAEDDSGQQQQEQHGAQHAAGGVLASSGEHQAIRVVSLPGSVEGGGEEVAGGRHQQQRH